jgi:hypothetical protein
MSRAPRPSERLLLVETLEQAGRVVVLVSGTAGSVAALLWVIEHGQFHPIVQFERRDCHPKVTESYVRAIAHAYGLRLETSLEKATQGTTGQLVIVVGARFGDLVQQAHVPGAQIILRPMSGRSEADILADLDGAGVRPHPAVTLGLSEVCSQEELLAGAHAARSAKSLEIVMAASAVEGGEFPLELALFDEGEKRETFHPATQTAGDFEGEPMAQPDESALGPDLGLDVLRVNGYPAPKEWPQEGPATRDGGKVWLFSYGSNSPRQLQERLGHPVKCVPGGATDRERTYVGHSKRWGAAVATLVPARGATALGGACLVSEDDLDVLDQHEGVPTKYRRQTIRVALFPYDARKRREITAVAYLAARGNQKLGAPSMEYLEAVLENVNAHGFKRKDLWALEPFALDRKGSPQILYPSGVTAGPAHDGENTAEMWLRLSPNAKRARLAWEKASGISTHTTIAQRDRQLEGVYGPKRWAKYRAEIAELG